MASIRLTNNTIRSYLGGGRFHGSQAIVAISCRSVQNDDSMACVDAYVPSSTGERTYNVSVRVRRDGSEIQSTSCTCPKGGPCKHIHRVLYRIRSSRRDPIPGPSAETLVREAQRRKYGVQVDYGTVFLAMACQSEIDSGSDFGEPTPEKSNVDQKILGVFLSKRKANQCAREYLLGVEAKMENDSDDADSDSEETFWYDGSDDVDFELENMFPKVWVERRIVEDATLPFARSSNSGSCP
ncbi:expressed unknown protein [Seminavis robusta]|uniref:SWIM-type domain-containing protein n=1 Tax=Seminavis robusta TaxID=568900 RepID=A0A9N8EKQ5_9STRA|nr:expressed unknown protein [Seminavis robusta]|eukprot:Sro1368_g266800.1 n/a (240) ;mRNA; f:13477-14273